MKWNSNNIIDFLRMYEKYPLLWNIKHKDYCNIKLKDELKAKIKNIKDVYRNELAKIEKSRKSGSGSIRRHLLSKTCVV